MGQEWCNWLLIGQEDISFLPLLMEASVVILEKNIILIAMEWKKNFFFFFASRKLKYTLKQEAVSSFN